MAQDNKTQLRFLRHGKTSLNHHDASIDRIRGWKDIPLSAEGIAEAKDTAKKLKTVPIDEIYTSDLSRARRTAQIVNNFHNVPLKATKDFRPWNLGVFQGQITKEVLPELKKYIADETKVPPKGESFESFRTRVLMAVVSLIKKAQKENSSILIATHYRVLKLVQAWVEKGMPKDLSVDEECMKNDKSHETGEVYLFPLSDYLKK